jgi:putative glutamine amidotransferase
LRPRIAIPVPHSYDPAYSDTTWPNYADAITEAGGEPIKVPLDLPPAEVARLISSCNAILLPGSKADVNPQRYGAATDPACGPADPIREAVDDMLLQDAHNLRKPILGICYGMQSLNVWRTGTLIQDLAPMPINHRAGRSVAIAHSIAVKENSALATMLPASPNQNPAQDSPAHSGSAEPATSAPSAAVPPGFTSLAVNSSHHQAIGIPGDGLEIIARAPQDGVVEAVQGTTPNHFVLGLQWHPERGPRDAASKAIFARFVQEAANWTPPHPAPTAS